MSIGRGFRRNPEDVADDILIPENYPAISQAVRDSVDAYMAEHPQSERRACQMFLAALMKGGFYVNYRPPITKENLRFGHIKFYNSEKGYGFVVPEDGSGDLYVSERLLRAGNLISVQRKGDSVTRTVLIQEGTPVEYVTDAASSGHPSISWIRIRKE